MQFRKAMTALVMGAAVLFSFKGIKQEQYNVDTQASKVTWVGKKVTGQHDGTVGIKEGKVLLSGDKLTGGSFVVDMNALTCTDVKDSGMNAKFLGHLKSDDFFSVAKFPTASFTVTKVEPAGKDVYKVTGDLTIKGTTVPQTFDVTVKQNGKTLTANGTMTVNRTKYDIKYGSGSFFEGLGDRMIYDDFTVAVALVAKK